MQRTMEPTTMEPTTEVSRGSAASGKFKGPVKRRRAHRIVVTHHAARRYAERVLAPSDPRHGDSSWLKRHITWLVHHSDCGSHLRRDPIVGPWLSRVGRENQGRPVVPCFHWERQVGFLLVEDRSDPRQIERVVLTCFQCVVVRDGQRRVERL